jgi:multidrug efflux pump subunit AcrA (membrane-fusion protein)
VVEENNGQAVAHQRSIKVGPIAGDNYPVLEGLKPGDKVVVSGAMKLMEGAPVVPQAAAPPPAAAPAQAR